MISLRKACEAWPTPEFDTVLKHEIESLDNNLLPLQQGLTQTSHVSEDKISAIILHRSAEQGKIHVKTGIFYSGVIAGCSCADDPTPLDTITEYCEVQFDIDRMTGEAVITLLSAE